MQDNDSKAAEKYAKSILSRLRGKPSCYDLDPNIDGFKAGCAYGRAAERKKILKLLRSTEARDYRKSQYEDAPCEKDWADWLESTLKQGDVTPKEGG